MIYIIGFFALLIGFEIGSRVPKKRITQMYETLDINNEGEILVSKSLKRYFEKENNYIIDNVTIANEAKKTTQIDHILINRYGIFVIETKHYSGWIFGNTENFKWTQTFPNGQKFSFYNPLKQNMGHIKTLSEVTGIKDYLFRSIIVFTGNAEIKKHINKNVIYHHELESYIEDYSLAVFKNEDIYNIIGKIEFLKKEVCEKTDNDHIEQIKNNHRIS